MTRRRGGNREGAENSAHRDNRLHHPERRASTSYAAEVSRANRDNTSSAAATVLSDPPRSFVRAPSFTASDTARSTALASASSPSEWRSSIAALRMVPTGFAIPFPAMSGAEP